MASDESWIHNAVFLPMIICSACRNFMAMSMPDSPVPGKKLVFEAVCMNTKCRRFDVVYEGEPHLAYIDLKLNEAATNLRKMRKQR